MKTESFGTKVFNILLMFGFRTFPFRLTGTPYGFTDQLYVARDYITLFGLPLLPLELCWRRGRNERIPPDLLFEFQLEDMSRGGRLNNWCHRSHMERAARTMWLRRSRITAQCIAFIGAGVGAAVAFFLSGSFWLILIGAVSGCVAANIFFLHTVYFLGYRKTFDGPFCDSPHPGIAAYIAFPFKSVFMRGKE